MCDKKVNQSAAATRQVAHWCVEISADSGTRGSGQEAIPAQLLQILQQWTIDLPTMLSLIPGKLVLDIQYDSSPDSGGIVNDENAIVQTMNQLANAVLHDQQPRSSSEILSGGRLRVDASFLPHSVENDEPPSTTPAEPIDVQEIIAHRPGMTNDDEDLFPLELPFEPLYGQEIWDDVQALPHYRERLQLIEQLATQLSQPLSAYFYDIIPPQDRPEGVPLPQSGGSRIRFENLLQAVFTMKSPREYAGLNDEFTAFHEDLTNRIDATNDPVLKQHYDDILGDALQATWSMHAFWVNLPKSAAAPSERNITGANVIHPKPNTPPFPNP